MATKGKKDLSELELELLRYLVGTGPRTVREAAAEFGTQNGYARTTVLTVMERLREKGYLARERSEGVWRYSPRVKAGELMQGVVERFVDRSLGGSVSPLVAYLAENPDLTDEEVERLAGLVKGLRRKP